MFNLGLESFHQADIVIKMEVPSQLRHIIRAGGQRTRVNPDPILEGLITRSAITNRGVP